MKFGIEDIQIIYQPKLRDNQPKLRDNHLYCYEARNSTVQSVGGKYFRPLPSALPISLSITSPSL